MAKQLSMLSGGFSTEYFVADCRR